MRSVVCLLFGMFFAGFSRATGEQIVIQSADPAGSQGARPIQEEGSVLIAACESIPGMGFVSRAIDRLPAWAQLTLMACGLAAGVFGLAHYGWSFLLKAIFSPVP
jgi:hypothetical protein